KDAFTDRSSRITLQSYLVHNGPRITVENIKEVLDFLNKPLNQDHVKAAVRYCDLEVFKEVLDRYIGIIDYSTFKILLSLREKKAIQVFSIWKAYFENLNMPDFLNHFLCLIDFPALKKKPKLQQILWSEMENKNGLD